MRIPVAAFSPTDSESCFCGSGKDFSACCGSSSAQRELPFGVTVIPGFLDADSCRKWVKRLEKQPRVRAKTAERSGAGIGPVKFVEDPSRVCDNVKHGVMRARVLNLMEKGFQHAVSSTGWPLAWFELPNILRYQAGGFYETHADSCLYEVAENAWYKVLDRDLSLLVYLNDDFTGGGLTFTKFNFHYRPRAGDLLLFPSDNRYEHQAEKVDSGIRYVIASWAAFQHTPKVHAKPPKAAIAPKAAEH
jgi:predicted 2-oxoglutarate/Fe(II)-dependent dioxygenase YbiX